MKKTTKVLVLTKSRLDYAGNTIGLANSADFVTIALNVAGYDAKTVRVADGNAVDRELHLFKPKVCILEALWVSTDKLKELTILHPHVLFVVRIHSNIPFLSMEGTAIQQLKELADIEGVVVSANNEQASRELNEVLGIDITYLPNVYLPPTYLPDLTESPKKHDSILDISCFGAIRPMKNQLIQTLAAIHAADKLRKVLHFHVNSTRVEQQADPILKNIISSFKDTRHKLVQHSWQSHKDFLQTVSKMDLGLQVSFSESYNIVTADHVYVRVPVVVSDEVSWLDKTTHAKTTDLLNISDKIIYHLKYNQTQHNRTDLDVFNGKSMKVWTKFLDRY
jgi:hypothetical protein